MNAFHQKKSVSVIQNHVMIFFRLFDTPIAVIGVWKFQRMILDVYIDTKVKGFFFSFMFYSYVVCLLQVFFLLCVCVLAFNMRFCKGVIDVVVLLVPYQHIAYLYFISAYQMHQKVNQYWYNIGWFEVDNRWYRPSLEKYCTSWRRVQYFAWRGRYRLLSTEKTHPILLLLFIKQLTWLKFAF